MSKIKRYGKRCSKTIIAFSLAFMILGEILPQEALSGLAELFEPLLVSASATAADNEAPECSFINELYDGSNAISPLPSLDEYAEQYGYTAPKNIPLTDFRDKCVTGLGVFDSAKAYAYMADGYKLMICDAEELYQYSQIVNGVNAAVDEIAFYLSANIVLGNNIEYGTLSKSKSFMPIGNQSKPFTGTFDGQNFEIRDLYIAEDYQSATVALFGSVGTGAVVKNFGIYHPTYLSTANASVLIAAVASYNFGSIENVYAIVQEYDTGNTQGNIITTDVAAKAAGLVAYNGGTLSSSYFAGMLNCSAQSQNPVCATNAGVVQNCYYDADVYQYGLSASRTDDPGNNAEITGLTNIQLKRLDGVENTSFKKIRLSTSANSTTGVANNVSWQRYFDYPRLYGFEGTGTATDPYLISMPADLIYFPCSYEYTISKVYFSLANCIDMGEVAPNAYQPKLDFSFSTNVVDTGKFSLYKWSAQIYKGFTGVLNGAAEDDSNCCLHHVTDMGIDSEGNPLQECHIIHNLTINTPATSTNTTAVANNYQWTALIAYVPLYSNYNTLVENLHFIGGEISSGNTDCMPASYSSTAAGSYNVRTATVVASSTYTAMTNVHSSATVKVGTGEQYSVAVGGLMGYGNFQLITDCTNSGDLIGGYVDVPDDPTVVSVNIRMGGLLGHSSANNTANYYQYGRVTHCANYGNVYAAAVVSDDSERKLTGGSSYIAGILSSDALGYSGAATATTGKVIEINQSNRVIDVANFGMLFDGPVVLDEDNDPIDINGNKIVKQTDYETEQPMPQALPLDEGKYLVSNQSQLFFTYINGVGGNVVSNAYNGGDIYSIMIEKCSLRGIGPCATVPTTTVTPPIYNNYMNYNRGNIYMYVGALEAHGIADTYAYKSCNEGNIFLYGGVVTSATNITSYSSTGGCFSGVAGNIAYGCYNKGNIYLAPSARAVYNNAHSNNVTISISGVSQQRGEQLVQDGVTIKNINTGKLTLDLEKNNFDAVANTVGTSGSITTTTSYFPWFYIMGTGAGTGNRNYGEFSFIPNEITTTQKPNLHIAGCGGLFTNASYTRSDNINYSDININSSPECLLSLCVFGVARGVASYGFSNNINFGDISFSGNLKGSLEIYTIGYNSITAKNNMNFGNVTIGSNTTISGTSVIAAFREPNNSSTTVLHKMDSIMNGWYDGCTIPDALNTEANRAVFDSLDKTKRYGTVTVSGDNINMASLYISMIYTYGQAVGSLAGEYISNMINNGEVLVSGAKFSGTLSTYGGLSNGFLQDSENHAPITYENNIISSSTFIIGASSGNRIVNYADLTIKNCVTRGSGSGNSLMVCGVGYTQSSSHLENRGNITIENLHTATVNGEVYTTPSVSGETGVYDAITYALGVSNSAATNSVNFGNISVSKAIRFYAAGINYNSSAARCINYGDIIVSESGGGTSAANIGGITALGSGKNITNCENFGNLTLLNPTNYYNVSALNVGNAYKCIGGISGYGGIIYSCANYGKITYSNDREFNSGNTDKANTFTGRYLYIGGIVGSDAVPTNTVLNYVRYVLNYGDITVENEPNLYMRVGGISGEGAANSTGSASTLYTSSYSMINYGDITVPYAANTTQNSMAGGILACFNSASTDDTPFGYYYGINYGTVQGVETEGSVAARTYIGSLLGYASTTFAFNKFVDLSEPPEGADAYPLLGGFASGKKNISAAVNYTKNEASISDTNAVFGTVELITLDKDDETGMFNYQFPFRSDLYHSYGIPNNQQNGLAYQEFDLLSPYLQAYMTEHFGEDIKNYGAYVMLNIGTSAYRSPDEYFPGKMDENGGYLSENGYYSFGCTDNYEDASLINDDNINALYASAYAPSERTIKTDLEYYAQQVKLSGIAELFDADMKTAIEYTNNDSGEDQYFYDYESVVDITSVTDTITVTNVKFFIPVDYIDTSDKNGELTLSLFVNSATRYSGFVYYNGDEYVTTEKYHYPDNDSLWLNKDNLAEKLSDAGLWNQLIDNWSITVPYDENTDIADSPIYTKIFGVMTAEDGVHKNIVIVHVALESLLASAEVASVTLTTPSGKAVTSTVENGLMTAEDGQESKSSEIKNDVIYYYMTTDDSMTVENIQRYNWSSALGNPTIDITTYNMTENQRIQAVIIRQDQIPVGDEGYNDLRWNDEKSGETISDLILNSVNEDIDDSDSHKPIGSVKLQLNAISIDKNLIFYGGLYRVDLYYEQVEGSEAYKHFASVFIAKQYSPENYHRMASNPNNTVSDTEGYYSAGISQYNMSPTSTQFKFAAYNRSANDKAVSYILQGGTYGDYGSYYSAKGYLGDGTPNTDITLGTDNVGESITKTLKNRVKSIYVYQNEETGAFYPQKYATTLDIMSEDGKIRTITHDLVLNGSYLVSNSSYWGTPPTISSGAKTKNGITIVGNGKVNGTDTGDTKFTCAWTSTNVIMSSALTADADGYRADRINVRFTPYGSDESRKLTDEEIAEYFTSISVNTKNEWTFTLSEDAPHGSYEMIPYMSYTTNLNEDGGYSDYVDGYVALYTAKLKATDEITLIDDDNTNSDIRDGNKFVWTIPYSSFTLENIPNDDSYLTAFEVDNDIYNPSIEEESDISGAENRSVAVSNIVDSNGEYPINYVGYENVKTGDNSVDVFHIYSYVAKSTNESLITLKAPYRSTILKWTGAGSPFDDDSEGEWISPDVSEQVENFDLNYPKYRFNVSYGGQGITTYYKVVAEDGINSTVYSVYVGPSNRNKRTSLEIAQSSEIGSIPASLESTFKESEEIYKEILEKYGTLSATIKELNGTEVDVYQTKMFDSISDSGGETEPYIYNLKSFTYDISVSLPPGYTYDIILFSKDMDSYQSLWDSGNGFDGKQLLISSTTDQTITMRIVLKRDTSMSVWGVQYFWNYPTARTDENGYIETTGGGKFNNYVYNVTS